MNPMPLSCLPQCPESNRTTKSKQNFNRPAPAVVVVASHPITGYERCCTWRPPAGQHRRRQWSTTALLQLHTLHTHSSQSS